MIRQQTLYDMLLQFYKKCSTDRIFVTVNVWKKWDYRLLAALQLQAGRFATLALGQGLLEAKSSEAIVGDSL